MILDLAVLAALAIGTLSGVLSGALRQVRGLLAAGLAAFAASALAAPIARGLAGTVSDTVARAAAPVLVFAGAFALSSILLGILMHGVGLDRAAGGPTDRGLGALLSGAKTLVIAWLVLSALAVAGSATPYLGREGESSEFTSLAREHNLLQKLAPNAVDAVEGVRKRLSLP